MASYSGRRKTPFWGITGFCMHGHVGITALVRTLRRLGYEGNRYFSIFKVIQLISVVFCLLGLPLIILIIALTQGAPGSMTSSSVAVFYGAVLFFGLHNLIFTGATIRRTCTEKRKRDNLRIAILTNAPIATSKKYNRSIANCGTNTKDDVIVDINSIPSFGQRLKRT